MTGAALLQRMSGGVLLAALLAVSAATLAGDAHVAASLEELLAFPDLDALVIVSPSTRVRS